MRRGSSPIQEWARGRVRDELEAGRLERAPCEACGEPDLDRVQAHHDDYLQPLAIRWLCVSCHHRWHGEHGRGANADAPKPKNPRRNGYVDFILGLYGHGPEADRRRSPPRRRGRAGS